MKRGSIMIKQVFYKRNKAVTRTTILISNVLSLNLNAVMYVWMSPCNPLYSVYIWNSYSLCLVRVFEGYCKSVSIYIKLKSRLSAFHLSSRIFLASWLTYRSGFCAKQSAHHLGITYHLNKTSNYCRSSFIRL